MSYGTLKQKIVDYLATCDAPAKPKAIAAATGLTAQQVANCVKDSKKTFYNDGSGWLLIENTSKSPSGAG